MSTKLLLSCTLHIDIGSSYRNVKARVKADSRRVGISYVDP